MLAMLGGFVFGIQENGYQKLQEKLVFDYAEHKKALGFRQDEAVGAYSESFTMNGTIILQNIHSLEALKNLAKNKEPVLLVFGTGYAYWVTVRDMDIDSSRFLKGGAALKREFSVNMKRYYFEQSVFSKIFSAFG